MFSLLSIIYFLGIIQGILLFFSLCLRKKNSLANRLLSILVLLMTLILLNGYLDRNNYHIAYPHLLLVTFPLPFLLGPIIYFYVAFLTKARAGWKKIDLLHLLPTLAVTAYLIPFYIKHDYQKVFAMIFLVASLKLLTLAIIALGVAYCLGAYFLLRRYQHSLDNYFSQTARINLNWLRLLLPAFFFLWGLFLFEYMDSQDIHFTYIGVTLLIYIIGYFSMHQPEIISFANPPLAENALIARTSATGSQKSRYEENATPKKWQALQAFMEKEKPFLEPDLTLADLAGSLSFSPHFLSYLINSRANKNFYHFINAYRVEEIKKLITVAQRRGGRHDLLSLAFDAGFSTKATFNAIFKQYTSMTPSQYRDSLPKNP